MIDRFFLVLVLGAVLYLEMMIASVKDMQASGFASEELI